MTLKYVVMYPDLLTSTVYPPALMLLKVYVPLVAVVVVPVVLPLVTFKPLLALIEALSTFALVTASVIFPETVLPNRCWQVESH